ncbi:tetratricopeptide repeat protein [Actinomadura rubrisoli]|uniref:Tetratricopeptide repeat protein n=2 Tax=Actinomadura rubrisoli TaxID=2530368 RepID=A0A4R4ZK85_9ACTN|nr:tetratricopeptide repeat protein [Actinomadura rubrisoli]
MVASFAMTSYPAQAYIWLGDAEQGDLQKAERYAQSALALQATAPKRKAIARIDLGIILAQTGEPEEAAALGCKALTTPRLVSSVRIHAANLNDVLTSRYPELPAVRDFGEALRQVRPIG